MTLTDVCPDAWTLCVLLSAADRHSAAAALSKADSAGWVFPEDDFTEIVCELSAFERQVVHDALLYAEEVASR